MGVGSRALGGRGLRHASWLLPFVLAIASCATDAPTVQSPGHLSSVVIGTSTRKEVLTALGRPNRIERSGSGESWVYEHDGGRAKKSGLVSGVAAASGVVGAFVPFAGLIGPGIGLANSVGGAPKADVSSETIQFGYDGLVRDCVLVSSALPKDLDKSQPDTERCQGTPARARVGSAS